MADDGKEAAREAAARKQREQDRQDLWREEGGLPSGRLRRFIFDKENDPRTPEGQAKKRAEQAMIRAAEWASQRVVIGGMEMTRADAQTARRLILDNPEHYARLARERGYIKPGEEEAFIARMRRMKDLEEKRERGETLSAAEEAESRRLEQSEAGTDGKIMRDALSEKGLAAGVSVKQADSVVVDRMDATQSYALRSAMAAASPLPSMKEILPGAPDVGAAFVAGKAAMAPLDAKDPPAYAEATAGKSPAASQASGDRNLKATLDI